MNIRGHSDRLVLGFTLIEVMVVVGLMVLLIGGFGAAMRQDSRHALSGTQLQVASLLERARLVAVSEQTDARLVVDAGDSDRFMRVLQVFALDASGAWSAASPALWLTNGISVVPPTGLGGRSDLPVNFSANRSRLSLDPAPRLSSDEFEGATRIAYIEYAANGTRRTADPQAIVLAANADAAGDVQGIELTAWRSLTIAANGTIMLAAGDASP